MGSALHSIRGKLQFVADIEELCSQAGMQPSQLSFLICGFRGMPACAPGAEVKSSTHAAVPFTDAEEQMLRAHMHWEVYTLLKHIARWRCSSPG